MDDVVEMEKMLNKQSNKGKRKTFSFQMRLNPKVLAAVDSVAKHAGMNRTEWIRAAIQRGLKNWKSPLENEGIWGPCRHCGHRHDPDVHYGE